MTEPVGGVPTDIEERVDAVVIGGGAAGLGAADELRRAGRSVVVLEAAPVAGGLARSIKVGGEPIEAYYHHIFPQDRETRALAERLGMDADLEWRPAPMAILHEGHTYPFNSPLDLLRLSAMSVPTRLRVGLATAVQVVRPDNARLDRVDVVTESRRWFGGEAFELLWRPLLAAKFGEDLYPTLPMAWLVARIRQRAGGRKAGGDRLGYLRGSLGRLLTAYVGDVEQSGVRVLTSAKVEAAVRAGGRWRVTVDRTGTAAVFDAQVVVAAVSGGILDRVVELPEPYRAAVRAIPYRGIVCALVEMDRRISPHYWVNVTTRLGLGCVGIIEHTNFIPADRYGGRHLVYLAHYVDRDGPTWSASPDELIDAVEAALRVLNPAYRRDWVRDVHVSRDPFAQPVPQVGGPMPSLPIETGLPGLFHASLAHVYPDDRGVSMALRLGSRVARQADAHLRQAGA